MRVLMGLAALAALGFAPAAAEAAPITSSITYSQFFPGGNNLDPGQTPQAFSPTDWDGTSQTVTLPQFDPALGTLNGVNLLLYGNIQTSGTLQNTGSSPAKFTNYTTTMDIAIPTPGASNPTLTVSPTVVSIVAPFTLQPGQTYSFGSGTPDNASDINSVSPDDTSPYVGTGTLFFPLTASPTITNNTTAANNDLVLNQVTAARAELSVTYDYTYDPPATSVPEPPSPALLGAGLLCLGLLRRRP